MASKYDVTFEALIFETDQHLLGVDITTIRGIKDPGELHKSGDAYGLMVNNNFHPLAMINIDTFLGIALTKKNSPKILMFEYQVCEYGIQISQTSGIHRFHLKDLSPVPRAVRKLISPAFWLTGFYRNRVVLFVDLNQLFQENMHRL